MKNTRIFSALSALVAIGLSVVIVAKLIEPDFTTVVDEAEPSDRADLIVRLTSEKAQAAGIKIEPVQTETLVVTRTLPARLAYDETKHVAVRAPTAGVLESVSVKTGDSVQFGQALAVLRSPAVGEARSSVLTSNAQLELARNRLRWQTELRQGVLMLTDSIRQRKAIASIEKELQDATLGDYRGKLLAKYSKVVLQNRLAGSVREIGVSGAISQRVIKQRQSELEQVEAELAASIEQARFETDQACRQAEADAESANRRVLVARQTLHTLIGATANTTSALDVSPNEQDLSRLKIVSPLTATIERKNFSATERVAEGDELFIVADTGQLWVQADVRQRDWQSIDVREGDSLSVTVPSATADNNEIEGRVYFVGREVNPDSGAIPLVATIANTDNQFRPGMFARVKVPAGIRENVITIPASAVIDLEGQQSVFVSNEDGFEPVQVEVGDSDGDRFEIRSGLNEGQQVVTAGVFVLKSELLLEGED